MSATTLISLDEYLNTSYEPDREFVDGVLVRRNVGTQRHGLLQIIVGAFLRQFQKTHGIRVFAETRLRMDAEGRHRIPDVMALRTPYRKGKVATDVPAITVEIKSPDDTFDDVLEKCLEYERLGVANILVMDPDRKWTWRFEHGDLRLLPGESVSLAISEGSAIDFQFGQMFAELDED